MAKKQLVEFQLEGDKSILVEVAEVEGSGIKPVSRKTGELASKAKQSFDEAIANLEPMISSIRKKIDDMHGNAWEWCADPCHEDYNNAPDDGSVWDEEAKEDIYTNYLNTIDILLNSSDRRVIRGGSWYYNPNACRSAYRYNRNADVVNYDYGFRVVCG